MVSVSKSVVVEVNDDLRGDFSFIQEKKQNKELHTSIQLNYTSPHIKLVLLNNYEKHDISGGIFSSACVEVYEKTDKNTLTISSDNPHSKTFPVYEKEINIDKKSHFTIKITSNGKDVLVVIGSVSKWEVISNDFWTQIRNYWYW